MNSLELMDLIGEVRGDYVMDAQKCREGKDRVRRLSRAKIILIAAAMALLLAGCTYAVMKLQELRMPITTKSLFVEDNGAATYSDNISMQGYAGSRNYLAAQEWYEFEKDYDKDFSLMRAADAARYLPPDAYWAYGCYTQTMIDKVNEICKKYHLELMGTMYIADDPVAEMFSPLGIDGVLSGKGNPVLYNGYYYGSGSFFVCGTTRLGDSDPIDYQLICNQKSAFSITGLNMEDIEAYTQWEYIMEDGTKVLLTLNGERAVILVDREDSFVTVNVTQSTGLTVQMLEDFADTFDFSFRVIRPDPPAQLIYEGEPTEFPESRPETTELEFWGEGMAYPEPATLHRGEGYSIYIPDEGWRFSRTQSEETWEDKWVSEYNEAVEIMVTFYPGATVEDFHTAITPAPITATEYGFWSMDRVGDENELVRLRPEARGIYALFIRYPREAGEGFSVQMATIANTFEAIP